MNPPVGVKKGGNGNKTVGVAELLLLLFARTCTLATSLLIQTRSHCSDWNIQRSREEVTFGCFPLELFARIGSVVVRYISSKIEASTSKEAVHRTLKQMKRIFNTRMIR